MRLTLRTLLAYLDDTLEPADHEALGQKIESSDFATELIHRTRDTVRRLRLGAPAVHAEDSQDVLGGDELTADANTVAEYIDNTLPPERVSDFERICLEPGTEADMHLAEVASCHHVLTMVLGEPAEIDEEVRKRMYGLPAEADRAKTLRIEPAHQEHQATAPSEPRERIAIAPAVPESEEPEVPDYLRAATNERHRKVRMLAAGCILALIAGMGYFLLRPMPEPELAGVDLGAIDQGLEIEVPGATDTPAVGGGADTEAPAFVPEEPAEPEVVAGETKAEVVEETPLPVVEPESSAPDTEEPALLVTEPTEIGSIDETPDPLDTDLDLTQPVASASSAGAVTPGVTEAPLPKPPASADTAVDPVQDPVLAETDEAPLIDPPGLPASPEPTGPVQVGNFLSGNSEILLRLEPVSGKWIRVGPRTPVTTGDQLLTLPTYRPHISLNETNIYLAGGTRVLITEPSGIADRTAVGMEVLYGKLLLNASLNGGPMDLRVGDILRSIQFGGSSSLAIQVRRIFVPGSNFEVETAPIEVQWYLTSGSLEWPTPGGGTQTITSPAMWKTADGVDELPVPIEELPIWIDHEEVTDMQRRAKKPIAEQLVAGEPVEMTLLEMNDTSGLGRRQEVRTLAAQSSLHVGQFEPFVVSLSDMDQRKAWNDHIDSLRAALALSPDVAARVREAFEDLRGTEAANDLMEMVEGYNEEQVGLTPEAQQNGVLVKLLGWLDSESLDYRVLATYNLDEITGSSYKSGYRPESDSTQRQRALRKLWSRFEENDLVPN